MGEQDDDPDWLRAFQPSTAPVVLLSGSDSSPDASPTRTTPSRDQGEEETQAALDHAGDRAESEQNKSKAQSATRRKNLSKKKDASGKHEDTGTDRTGDTLEHQEGVADADMQDKPTGNSVSQRLPLIFPDKVQRSKALIECDGDSIDLSGDVGAVGRIVVSNSPTGNQDLLLDLKGTVYKTTIVPSRTFCVVSVGQSEAKIEAIMNDFIQLEPQSNLFEAETMMEGTLDGFTFDSDEEGEKHPESHASQNDQNNEDEDQPKAKAKRKAEKPAAKGQKKAKVAVKAGAKKGGRKTQSTKRTKKARK
ncbi:hypothetical protein ACP4OV_009685 [Aristida adscensionis]